MSRFIQQMRLSQKIRISGELWLKRQSNFLATSGFWFCLFLCSCNFSTWAFGCWEFHITPRVMWVNSIEYLFSRNSPQTPKNLWKQWSQNLALYCMYLKWNSEFPIGRCWKQKKRQTKYFGFYPFYLEHIKGWWDIRWKSNSEMEN